MAFIIFVLSILSIIATWRMIREAFRLGYRIANATEVSARNLTMLCDALAPEAKQRAIEVAEAEEGKNQALIQALRQKVDARQAKNDRFITVAGLVGLVIILLIVFARIVSAGEQTRIYAPDGRSVGTAVPQGEGTIRFYDSRGKSIGTSTTTGDTTTLRDPGGNVTGRTTSPMPPAFQGGRR
jgi:hypothetical protein